MSDTVPAEQSDSYSLDPHGRYFSAQEQTGASGDCGMHSIRNLLCSDDVSADDLHSSATRVAKITGDDFENHENLGAWWSADTIIFELSKRGFDVDYNHDSNFDFDDDSILGYIIHIPHKSHFVSVRRSTVKEGFVEIVDSMTGIETMRQRRLTLNAKNNQWNIISVKRKSRLSKSYELRV